MWQWLLGAVVVVAPLYYAKIANRAVWAKWYSCAAAYSDTGPWHVDATTIKNITCALRAIKTHGPIVIIRSHIRVIGWQIALVMVAVGVVAFQA